MQEVFDDLYSRSKAGQNFTNLYEIIISPSNIQLAYRNIKGQKGSKTPGADNKTIDDWKVAEADDYVEYVQRRLQNYFPQKVRRKEIPKANGKTRPLGIPSIQDRLIQQAMLQVLQPIAEAKFYPYSYGFRPNRSTSHAIQEFCRKINWDKVYYVVDVDIKGFFDNVNHGKLLKQLWTFGIRDKKVISIISKMLKAPILQEDGTTITPTKGVPQGGILSPLLANIVLNELDWWVHSQWKGLAPKISNRKPRYAKNGTRDLGNEFREMRDKTKLKEMSIVRYADDFKIFCRDKSDADKTFLACKQWLRDRLDLEISPEKSGVVDLTKKPSEFLGFNIMAMPDQNGQGKLVAVSHMSNKSKDRVTQKLREAIDRIKEHPTPQNVLLYNSIVMGQQMYYRIATRVSRDFSDIEYRLYFHRYGKLKQLMKEYKPEKDKPYKLSATYMKYYGSYNFKIQMVQGIALFPVAAVKNKPPMGFKQQICDYTAEGRKFIHDNLKPDLEVMVQHLSATTPMGATTELADNRLSRYTMQQGKCAITKADLIIGSMELHHIKPKHMGGTDEFNNLIWVTSDSHKLIHATQPDTIRNYLARVSPDPKQLAKLNTYRELAGNVAIK